MGHAMLCLGAVCALFIATRASSRCPMQYTSSLQFSVTSEVNETGQRYVTVELQGEAPHAECLGLSISHWTAQSEGLEIVGFKVNASAPINLLGPPSHMEITAEETGGTPPTSTEMLRPVRTTVLPTTVKAVTTPNKPTTTARPTIRTTTVNPDSVCSPGYKVVAGVGCYKGNRTLLKWEQARLSCETEGALLATPDTRHELDGIWRIADPLPLWPWVGIYKREGAWVTVQGGPVLFPAWAPGEPSGGGRCVIVYSDGLINNLCNMARPFICEHRLP